jgi:hypothetical protein
MYWAKRVLETLVSRSWITQRIEHN